MLLVAYEWSRAIGAAPLPLRTERALAARAARDAWFLLRLRRGGARRGEFLPADKKPIMARNMRDIFHRLELTEQDVRTLRGAFRALAEGRRLRKP